METDLHRVIYSHQVTLYIYIYIYIQDLTDEHIQYFLYQTLRGVLFMHSGQIIHRDIKPSNLLLNKNCDLKICDFGLARGYGDSEDGESMTEYVVTRWYRAPEVILNASMYSKAIDIWSIGCVFAELLGRAPLFPGENYLDQVKRIVAILGTPTRDDMAFIGNDAAKKYIRSLPKRTKQVWSSLYSKANPVALDLLGRMLVFSPDKRYSIEECLEHPYFEGLHAEDSEPLCEEVFDWTFDDFEPTKDLLQIKIMDIATHFHP